MKNLGFKILAFFAVLASQVMGHPGPPGHTHGDDWPFGAAILIAVLVGAAFFTLRKSSQQ